MSHHFGKVGQVAYVVDDVEDHIDHWTKVMGVGPFFLFPLPLPFDWLEIRGERVAPDTPVFEKVAVSFSGDMMIEFIQPGPVKTTYTEFLESGRRGVHHLGTYTDRYEEQMAAARANGITVLMEGLLPFSQFAYLETDRDHPGTVVEIIKPFPAMTEMMAEMKAIAASWDGKERTRSL